MKKNLLSLRALLLMSIAIGSTFITEATQSSNKSSMNSSHKKCSVKSIERDLERIKRDFRQNHDSQTANKRLKKVQAQIKEVITELKRTENNMWKVHERTLNRKLTHVRNYIKNNVNTVSDLK